MTDLLGTSGAAGPPPPSVSTLRAGTLVGGYELLRRLGAGGMGVVWEARDGGGQRVAMKILHPQIAADPVARRRLDREARVLGRVKDARVARILDIEASEGDLSFVITELVDGPTLQHEVDQQGPYDLATDARELSDLAHGLVGALQAVHAADVIHRDLKPSNVMLGSQGPVLIDFGIAQVADDTRLTQTGQVTGTPGFIPPEMLDGGSPSESVDWYACAGVLLFTLTGRAPFGSGSWQSVFRRVYAGTPEVGTLETDWPSLAQAFTRALAPDVEDRLDILGLLAVIDEIADGGTGEKALAALGEGATETGTYAGGSYGFLSTVAPHATPLPPAQVAPLPASTAAPRAYGMAPRSPGTGGWETGASQASVPPQPQHLAPATQTSSPVAPAGPSWTPDPSSQPPTAQPVSQSLPPAVPVGSGAQVIPPRTGAHAAPAGPAAPTGQRGLTGPGAAYGVLVPAGQERPLVASSPQTGPQPVAAGPLPTSPGTVGVPAVLGGVPDWAKEPRRHRLVVLTWAMALTSIGMVRPGWVAIAVALGVVVAGTVGRAEDARRWARVRRGSKASGDTSRMWAASPWYLLRSLVAGGLAVVLGVVGGIGAFLLLGRAFGYGTDPTANPLLPSLPESLRGGIVCGASVAVLLLITWFVPWNSAGRRGMARLVEQLAPSGPMRLAHVVLLLVVTLSMVVLVTIGQMAAPSLSPFLSS